MFLNVSIVTENNYFFIGVKEHLDGDGRVVRRVNPCELKDVYWGGVTEDDILIFHASNYIDEFLFLVSTPLFRGKVIFIPINERVRFDLGFKKHVFLDARANIDMILSEVTKLPTSEIPKTNLTRGKLTKREKVILFHTINGMDVQSISQFLSISKKTVYAHRRNALHKLGGRNFFEIWPMKEQILRLAIF